MLALLIVIPVLVGIVALFFGKPRITLTETLVQMGVVAGLMVAGYYLTRWVGLWDYEIWNGRIASKVAGDSSCCHDYKCKCHTVCDNNGMNCTEKCSTCYEHSRDLFWAAYSTNNERVYIDNCNPPGTREPETYRQIRIGEPTAWEHRFTNYVKADPESLLPRPPQRKFAVELPAYPRVSGWRARRFLFVGLSHPEAGRLDEALAELNANLGPVKQVNLIVVVAAEADPAYADALAAAWLGGKKNDVILVIGVPDFPSIRWARVISWNQTRGSEDDLKGELIRQIEALGTFDGAAVLRILGETVRLYYVRRPFSTFAHLIDRATPPTWAMGLLIIVGLGLSVLLSWIFWRNDPLKRNRLRAKFLAEYKKGGL